MTEIAATLDTIRPPDAGCPPVARPGSTGTVATAIACGPGAIAGPIPDHRDRRRTDAARKDDA